MKKLALLVTALLMFLCAAPVRSEDMGPINSGETRPGDISAASESPGQWYETFTVSPVGLVYDGFHYINYVQGDNSVWQVYGGNAPSYDRSGTEITPEKALRIWVYTLPCCVEWYEAEATLTNVSYPFGKPLLEPGVRLRFRCSQSCIWSPDPPDGLNPVNLELEVRTFGTGGKAYRVRYLLAQRGPQSEGPVIPLAPAQVYDRDLWQDIADTHNGLDPTGFSINDIEISISGQGGDRMEAVFDDIYIGPQGHTLTVSAFADPTFIPSGGTTNLNAATVDNMGHGIASWHWSDNGAGGTFSPNANVPNPTWKAPGNRTGGLIDRRLTVTATCSGSPPIAASDSVTVTEDSCSPPVNVSLSPNTGCLAANTKLKFTSKYSDGDGYANLANCYLLLNTSRNQVNAVFTRYDQNTNLLYLKNDANTDWGTGAPPGSANVLQNSQCKLYCANTTVTGSGTTLTVSWMLEIKPSMSGKTCGAWMLVYDDIGLRDGWDQMGSNIKFNRPPYFCGLTPNSGSLPINTPVTLTAKFCDPDGDIASCYLLLNTSLNQVNAILIRYDPNTNLLCLKNDANTIWDQCAPPGSAQVLENSQCKLYCAQTTVSCSGTTLTINLRIELKPVWSEKRVCAWGLVYDGCGFRGGWTLAGCFNVGMPPLNLSLSPNSGSPPIGTPINAMSKYSDPDGYENLANCYLLVNTSLSQVNAGFLRYDANANLLYLKNDANTDWGTGYPPGAAQVLENSQCKLYCEYTTVNAFTETTLTVVWKVEIKPSMCGKTCGAWMLVYDDTSLRDGWDQMGTVVLSCPPLNASLDPNTGDILTGTQMTLAGEYSDPQGYADLANCYLLLNTSLSQVNAAFVRYDANANLLYVKDDANTDWGTGYAPGATQVLENSQCKLYCADTTVSGLDTNLTVNWRLELKSGIPWTSCKAWALVYDDIGLRDGYDQMATFTVQ